MNREDIKKIVYECASNRFYSKKDFNDKVNASSYDGENLLLYSELGFDSLDMVTFIIELENKNKLLSELPDTLFNKEVTLGKIIDYLYNKTNEK